MSDHIETTTLVPSKVNGSETPTSPQTPISKPKRGRGRPRNTEKPLKSESVSLTEAELATLGRLLLLANESGLTIEQYVDQRLRPLLEVYTKAQKADRLIY